MLSTIRNYFYNMAASKLRITSRYSPQLNDIPEPLYAYWKRSAQFEFKGIPQDAFFFASAAEGLMIFFDCVRNSARPCALPSQAADSVWHAWARYSPEGLERFCRKHFGRNIPHIEGPAMAGQMDLALANCMVEARRLDNHPVGGPSLPRLFALDRKLRMPGGFSYMLLSGVVGFTIVDGDTIHYPDCLSADGLLAYGLITREEYHAAQDLRPGSGCSSSGSSCGTSACDGAGCGSGCGGGCGGGD